MCRTCNSAAKKHKVPCQDVVNGLFSENIAEELGCLNNLEIVLIAKRLNLKKKLS